ncbi:MAG: CPBP family intramembrane metalloprotease [Acidobacteriia bacterium]|nr:CPBP family intramembrane metalloprotease [Terriglobia bacterium]
MTLESVFRGPNGYRAGWRFLLFCVIFFAFQFMLVDLLLQFIVARAHLPVPAWPNAVVLIAQDGFTLIAVLGATLIMAKLERRRLGDYYIPGGDCFGREFWVGSGFGFASVSLLIGLIALAGGYSLGELNLHGVALVRAALLWVLASLAIGFTEELVFRAYPQYTLASGMGFWPAAALISFAFGALHYFTKPQERWTDWASVSLLALFICLTLQRTGSLRFAIGFHAAFDFFAIYFYSGPNGGKVAANRLFTATFHGRDAITGGPLGPEASLMVFPVIALMFLAFHWVYRQKA